MDLSGTWAAAVADEELRRVFADPDLDDDAWEQVPVPGHWRSVPAFADTDGPVLHRRRFEASPPPEGRRRWLVLDGVFYQGDVWLDGLYLGDTEGYFNPHTFEITGASRERSEHTLAVEVTCSAQTDRTAKRNITGVFQHWDCLDPDWNPGGIWRPVRVEDTGPVRIRSLRVLCRDADERTASIGVRADLESDAARAVQLRTIVAGTEHTTDRQIAEGANWVEWEVTVDQPELWWPRALGPQPLTEVEVEVRLPDEGGAVSHKRSRRTGLRRLEWRNWTLRVNGERMFLKGSNHGPTRMAIAEATPDELRSDVTLACEAGLDLLRIHGHITRPELYDAADEAGLLLWQDFPLQWGYARGIRKQAARQAHGAVDLLGHHPSVALWCGHNEPIALDLGPGEAGELSTGLVARYAVGQQLPTWNKTVLDRSVKRALERADGTRPVIPHSGVLPHVGSMGTDSHLYFGWYHGEERDLPGFTARFPRLSTFVSEFGAQAVPVTDDFLDPGAWPDLDWDRLGHTHGLQKGRFDRYVPPAAHATFEAWAEATRDYQAELVKHHVEHLRRLKYRPTGGFCHFSLADGHPAVSWSVLDHQRAPKAAYHALAAACAPVIVVADRLPAVVAPGTELELAVHVVSDRRDDLGEVTVSARLCWVGGDHTWMWEGNVPADSCVRVGVLDALVPDVEGPLSLELSLRGNAVEASNRYGSSVSATRPS